MMVRVATTERRSNEEEVKFGWVNREIISQVYSEIVLDESKTYRHFYRVSLPFRQKKQWEQSEWPEVCCMGQVEGSNGIHGCDQIIGCDCQRITVFLTGNKMSDGHS